MTCMISSKSSKHSLLKKFKFFVYLYFHSNTPSHWSSGSTVCFQPRRVAVHIPGMNQHLQWNQVLLLAMSRYIGDLDMIPDHRLRLWLSHAFLRSILLLATLLLLLATQWPVKSPGQVAGGGSPVEALQLHSNTQSHWSSGSTISLPPMGAAICIPGMYPHLQWNWVLLLAMSCYSTSILKCLSGDLLYKEGQVHLVRLFWFVHMQTDNFHLFLCQQMDKRQTCVSTMSKR